MNLLQLCVYNAKSHRLPASSYGVQHALCYGTSLCLTSPVRSSQSRPSGRGSPPCLAAGSFSCTGISRSRTCTRKAVIKAMITGSHCAAAQTSPLTGVALCGADQIMLDGYFASATRAGHKLRGCCCCAGIVDRCSRSCHQPRVNMSVLTPSPGTEMEEDVEWGSDATNNTKA